MKMKVILREGARLPLRAHEDDAGLDLLCPSGEEKTVKAGSSAVFDTGVCVQIPEGCAGFLMSKSGLNVKHGLTSEGVIDCGYTGTIRVKLYNNSDEDYEVQAGDKISQLIVMPVYRPELQVVYNLEKTERGAGGFGSTGR